MKLDTLLIEIRRRTRTPPLPHVDPWRAIRLRCAAQPETLENRTLSRIAEAIKRGRGDFDDADIWALSQDALGLLDAVIQRRLG